MEKNVTSSINYTTYTANFANMSKCEFYTASGIIGGTFNNAEELKKAINESITDAVTVCGKIESFTTITERRSMPLSTFISLADEVEKRKNGDYIFRTIKTVVYYIVVFDGETGMTTEMETTATKLDKKTARKRYPQYDDNERYSIVGVKAIEQLEKCYQIKTVDFINHSTRVDTTEE